MKNKFINSIIHRIFGADVIQLEKCISAKEAEIARLQSKLNSTETELSRSQNQLTTSQSSLISTTSALDETRASLSVKEAEIARLQSKLSSIETELTQTQNELTTSKSTLTSITSELDKARTSARHYQITSDNRDQEIKELKDTINEIKHNHQLLSLDKARLTLSVSKLTKSSEELQNQIAANKSTFDNLNGIISAQKDQISVLESELKLKTSELSEARLERDSLSVNNIRKEETLSSIKEELKLAKDANISKDQEIDKLNSDISSLSDELISVKNRNKSDVELRDLIDQLNFEIDEKTTQIERLNHDIDGYKHKVVALNAEKDELLSEIKESKSHILELEECLGEKLSLYEDEKRRVLNLENTISALSAELDKLRNCEHSVNVLTPDDEQNQMEEDGQDFEKDQRPTITKNSNGPRSALRSTLDGPTKDEPINRTIDKIFDVESAQLIASDIIFGKSEQYIIGMRHLLSEAVRTGKPKWICPYCNQMVRIVGRNTDNGTKYFFSHLHDSADCEIKTISFATQTYLNMANYAKEGATHQFLKDTIAELLSLDKSKEKGVSDVGVDKRIFGSNPLFRWRQPDVTAKFQDLNLVFELQLSYTFLDVIAQRDLFYRHNNQFVIWVSYLGDNHPAINYLAHKDLYFTNKRNIFIIDNEAIEESKLRGELLLKCNWVNSNNQWHFPITAQHLGGCFVSLSDLKYDENTHKPYYYDAEEEYFALYPNAKAESMSLEQIMQSRINKFLNIKNETGSEKNNPGTLNTPIDIETTYACGNISIVRKDKKYGVEDSLEQLLIPFSYDEILPFNDSLHLFRAKLGFKWGIINIDNDTVLSFDFASIGILSDGKAFVKDLLDWDGYIDEKASILPNLVKSLDNEYEMIQIRQNYGLRKDGNVVLPIKFSKIEPIKDLSIIQFSNTAEQGLFSLKTGNSVVRYFDKITPIFSGNYLSVYFNGEIEILDSSSFKSIIANIGKFTQMPAINKAIIQKVEDGKWYIFDLNSKSIISESYSQLYPISDCQFMATSNTGLKFRLDSEGSPIETSMAIGKFHKTSKSGLFGLTSNKGKELIATDYIDLCSYRGKIVAIKPDEVHFYNIDNDNHVSMDVTVKGKKGNKWFAVVGSRTVIINARQTRKATQNGIVIKIGDTYNAYVTHVSLDGSLIYVGLVFGGKFIIFDTKHYKFVNQDNNIK